MPNMTSYDRGDVVLATLPFSDLTGIKQRPAVVVSAPHPSVDLLLLPLTSQLEHLQLGRGLWDQLNADVAMCLVSESPPHQRVHKFQHGSHPCEARTRGYLLDTPLGFPLWPSVSSFRQCALRDNEIR